MKPGGTHIRLGAHRIDLQAGNSIADFAELLAGITRINMHALSADPVLREEAFRRGFQWTTDPKAKQS